VSESSGDDDETTDDEAALADRFAGAEGWYCTFSPDSRAMGLTSRIFPRGSTP